MATKSSVCLVVCIVFLFSMSALAAPANVVNEVPDKLIKPITLTAPYGGETWQSGVKRNITWKYAPTAFKAKSVQILLLKGNLVVKTIASGIPVGVNGQGAFTWNALDVTPGDNYRIKIMGISAAARPSSLGGQTQFDISDPFTITEKAKITVAFPQAMSQTYYYGQRINITWDYSGDIGSTIYLRMIHGSDLPNGGLFSIVIDAAAPAGSGGHGSYTWVIPAELPVSSTYFIDIGSEYAGVGASGRTFTIAKAPAGKVGTGIIKSTDQPIVKPGGRVMLDPQPEPPSPQK